MERKSKSKAVLLLSDLHIGSTVGLWPAKLKAVEGQTILPNEFQKWLLVCWEDMQKWAARVLKGCRYDLVVNGDLVEGIHHKSLQIMSHDVEDQLRAVQALLGGFVKKASSLYIIKGTEVHTRNDEIRLGESLRAEIDPSTGQAAWDRLDLEVHGCKVSFAHHIGTTSRPYLEASQHSINLGVEIIEAARTGGNPPKVICRAHRHRHGVWNDGTAVSVTTGAWQGVTRFGRKVVQAARPMPSAVILDWRRQEKGELPTVEQKVYIAGR